MKKNDIVQTLETDVDLIGSKLNSKNKKERGLSNSINSINEMNSLMKNYQNNLKITDMVKIMASTKHKELEYNSLCNNFS